MGLIDTHEAIKNEKQRLRSQYRKLLKSFSDAELAIKSESISLKLQAYLSRWSQPSVGVYSPLKDEVIWNQSAHLKIQDWLYPAMTVDGMKYFRCRPEELVVRTEDFGIDLRVPPTSAPEVTPDIVLVPGLAFDKNGVRLGRGGGFFDRYFSEYRGLKLGLCFDQQWCQFLPCETHDQKMDALLTETQLIEVSPFKESE